MKKIFSSVAKITILSFLILALAPLVVPAISSDAFAQSGTTVSTTTSSNVLVDTVCNVLKIITGNAGKAFAAFAIISVGIGFFTGKVSWGLMIGVAAGIAAMFGAPSIVSAITGKGAYDCGA
ncbi:MAG: hypothetical protein A2887_01290 [Alphaproteobacteria bacterium RIFCSPLOWO2_01_FULL_40_26]|nr:MAG: hypothetical protein A3D15_00600 [Alphaproteobacteria bacterium RIFCSPHIGHO2_02_FULL_40_34]OFW87725.1 MAG: hypothetical protein A2794_01140 [Alphaproteobacteria bacterium RIFCSPHIGHO2_01_FULL_40_8]OFW94030.1 MAG: hypothetical protein A2887_01290 [Alphaproteobacteria bacterium RIFCSPLOWO2_01_FULL_40_26]OFX09565.1 MAG: hypothetical protein A3H30_05780 [Alphaproteobacteria bacterium RIFCSPLOWO2_02_FULL_40_19]OFX12021.1 MAG: hypothetical protein A3G22_05695 [Alphaproteobacteria bacterium RI